MFSDVNSWTLSEELSPSWELLPPKLPLCTRIRSCFQVAAVKQTSVPCHWTPEETEKNKVKNFISTAPYYLLLPQPFNCSSINTSIHNALHKLTCHAFSLEKENSEQCPAPFLDVTILTPLGPTSELRNYEWQSYIQLHSFQLFQSTQEPRGFHPQSRSYSQKFAHPLIQQHFQLQKGKEKEYTSISALKNSHWKIKEKITRITQDHKNWAFL